MPEGDVDIGSLEVGDDILLKLMRVPVFDEPGRVPAFRETEKRVTVVSIFEQQGLSAIVQDVKTGRTFRLNPGTMTGSRPPIRYEVLGWSFRS